MFKLDQSDSYQWPVTVEVPSGSGKREKESFTAIFKRFSESERQVLFARLGEADYTVIDVCRKLLVGWKDVVSGGQDIEFTTAALDQLLDIQGVALAVADAYQASVMGAPRKN